MRKKKEEPRPRKLQLVFEVEESQTNCCECLFGAVCPYACAFNEKLDCSKLNLGSLELKSITPIEE